MGSQHGRYESDLPAKLSTKRSASCLNDDEDYIQDEPAQVRTREFSVETSSRVLHEFEQSLPIPTTHLDPTVPKQIEPADLVTPDPLTPDPLTLDPLTLDPLTLDPLTLDPLTPHPVTPDKSIWATFLASLGFRSLAGSVNKSNENHKDHHRPEPKEEEDKTTQEVNDRMALVRDNRMPRCKYGTHRRLNQQGDDVQNKVCKFHKSKLTEEKKWLECE